MSLATPGAVTPPPAWPRRLLAAAGALACGLSVGLGAYASHAASPEDARRLAIAALFAFGHGLALAALAPREPRRLGLAACALFGLGVLGFSGSLVGAVFAGTPTALAPLGGSALMLGWALLAIARLRG